MGNLDLYNAIREVPQEAQKPINAGRLKGMTDINPMWRIKALTEQFGVCGVGWYYECIKQWIEEVDNERVACVNINLYIKVDGEWSKPIFGTGGSKLSTVERSGVYVSDECYKMATTDAISVACKNLGMGADIYWNKDRTKYDAVTKEQKEEEADAKKTEKIKKQKISEVKVMSLQERCTNEGIEIQKIIDFYKLKELSNMTEEQFMHCNTYWENIKGL